MSNRNSLWPLSAVVGAALLAFSAVPQLKAAGFNNDMTTVTFSGPVEIGNQALGAGTYIFKTLTDDRNIVEVFNQNESQLVALLSTIPVTAPVIPEATQIKLKEGPAGTPESVHEWFYPGESTGWEFRSMARH